METPNLPIHTTNNLLNIFPLFEPALKNCPDIHNRIFRSVGREITEPPTKFSENNIYVVLSKIKPLFFKQKVFSS